MKYIEYDTKEFKFKEIIKDLFEIESTLQTIHNDSNFTNFTLITRENDQNTTYHDLYYDLFEDVFQDTYRRFIRDVIKKNVDFDFYFQSIPTFRIQPPDNKAVGEFHKDKNYNHNEKEINFYLPFTCCRSTNTIWVESEEDKGDYEPILAKYGDVIQWDGSNLTHGNKINKSGFTRISVDFRIIPADVTLKQNVKTINTDLEFSLGSYWEKL